ncbi:hypothetical protein GGU11DRAFT_812543 [Lentinula aff. detonsa]|nr:hypothetical protein GGU11DRAFT_812543 [Lentinula aff. detonsa]
MLGLVKLIILSYLVLPQTDGSTHLYDQVLAPWFSSHEAEVDGALEELRKRVYEFIQTKMRAVWELLLNSTALGQAFPSAATPAAQAQPSAQPPTLADPISGPAQLTARFWRSYGPNVLAAGASLYKQFAPANAPGQAPQTTGYDVGPEDRPVLSRMSTIIERRRQLEAELAALNADEASAGTTPPLFPVPQIPASSASSSPTARTHGLQERTTSNVGPGGRFEEIGSNDLDEEDESGVGHDYGPRPGMPSTSRFSWFNWGGGRGSEGYEWVKNE